jgi:steroid delta-isomerase-like uncharacterized protein
MTTTAIAIVGAAFTLACAQRSPRSQESTPVKRPPLLDLQKQSVDAAQVAINRHDVKAHALLYAPDAVVSEFGLGEVTGRDAIAKGMTSAFIGFPDYKIGISKVFVDGETLVEEWVVTGTNTGPFNGAEPTGKTMGVRGATVLTFTPSGLIKTEHRYFDTPTIMSQLGLMDGPGPIATLPGSEPTWVVASGTPEENQLVSIGKAIMGALNSKSESDFLAALSDDLSWTVVAQSNTGGKEISKKSIEMIAKQLPDASFTSSALFGAGDVIVSEWTMTAPHVTLHALELMVVRDGKVVSGSLYSNSFEQHR